MNSEIINKLKAIELDEEFMKELFSLDTPEKIREKFLTVGIEFTLDEVKKIICETVDAASSEELDENELENISGGGVLGMAIFLGMTAAGVYIGWRAARGKC